MRDRKQATVLSLEANIFNVNLNFLVDSGAERSILPPNLVPRELISPSSVRLKGANDANIACYGEIAASVFIPSLNRSYKVNVVVADTKPILGADFLTKHGLVLDMRLKKLHDPMLNKDAILAVNQSNKICITLVKDKTFISSCFPGLLGAPEYDKLTSTTVFHRILTTGPPRFCRPRPLPPLKLDIAKAEFHKLLELNIIRPSSSPWASPLHMVKKSDGSWRPCGDYRSLNNITIPDRYPIPNLQSFHHKLEGAVIFSKIDLVKAYHFIPVAPEDVEKTAICTPFIRVHPNAIRASKLSKYISAIYR